MRDEGGLAVWDFAESEEHAYHGGDDGRGDAGVCFPVGQPFDDYQEVHPAE